MEDWQIKMILEKRIGEPYGQPHRCMAFLAQALALCDLTVTEAMLRDARDFVRIEGRPRLADIAVFQKLPWAEYHAAMMLDSHWAIQSCEATNGVGRIDISRAPWAQTLRGIYRHKSKC